MIVGSDDVMVAAQAERVSRCSVIADSGVSGAGRRELTTSEIDANIDLIAERFRDWPAASGDRLEMVKGNLDRKPAMDSIGRDDRGVGESHTDLLHGRRRRSQADQ